MDETEAIIERVTQVNPTTQHLDLAIDDALKHIKPGQSLLVRPDGAGWQPYLREHWWPVNVRPGKIIVDRPLANRYDTGQVVNVIGPVGQPFRFRRTLRNVLLIAYDTSPTPLLMTIPWLLGNQISVTLVLLGAGRAYETRHINPEIEIIVGDAPKDDAEDPIPEVIWPNQVMTIGWADQVFVVTAPDNELERFKRVLSRFQGLRAEVPRNYIFAVFQPPMVCGAGACSACMLQMRKGTQLICTDGPAFDLTQVVLP